MATIKRYLAANHLKAGPNAHVIQFRRGRAVRSGRGLAFWYVPLATTLAEIPCDDRDQTFLFHARSSDFQDVTAQGVITYRVVDPEVLATRIDFSIDPDRGRYVGKPLEQLSHMLVQAAQQHAWAYLASTPVRTLLAEGVAQVRSHVSRGLIDDQELAAMGLEIVHVRVSGVAPPADLEKALQAPTHEAIQQEADEAMFQRRALAVEKERAIQENELQNQIELAKREEQLIAQKGQNDRQTATEEAEARRIAVEARAAHDRLKSAARADGIRTVEDARVGAEKARMEVYRDLPSHVLMGLAAQELAGKLERIEHLNISPEMLGPLLHNLMRAGTERLETQNEVERN